MFNLPAETGKSTGRVGEVFHFDVDCRWTQDVMQISPVLLRQHSTIRQAIDRFISEGTDSLLVVSEAELTEYMKLAGRIGVKDVIRLLLPSLLQKDLLELNRILESSVDSILIKHPRTVSPWSSIGDVMSVMLGDYTQVVGVEYEGKMLGQINCSSLLNLFADQTKSSDISKIINPSAFQTKVEQCMADYTVCLNPGDDISKATCYFLATANCYVPVLDQEARLIGIISQRQILDYIGGLLNSIQLGIIEDKGLMLDCPVSALIRGNVKTTSLGTDILTTLQALSSGHCSCLAITDSQQNFCGILSCADIFGWLHQQLSAHA